MLVARALLVHSVAVVAASGGTSTPLRPCGDKAAFVVTQDGGTAFEAVLRVPRFQPGKRIQLDFGSTSVRIRPESVEGATLILASGANAHPIFRLDKVKSAKDKSAAAASSSSSSSSYPGFPPGAVSFRADGLPASPTISCDLDDALAAFPPAPPPPPPECAASLMWRLGRKWSGGFEAFVDVGGAGIARGGPFVLRIDFGTLSGLELLASEGATPLPPAESSSSSSSSSGSVMMLATNFPDGHGKGTATLRVRGPTPGSPRLSCVLAPPMPPPPPSRCALDATWQVEPAQMVPKGGGASGDGANGGGASGGGANGGGANGGSGSVATPRFSATVTLGTWIPHSVRTTTSP